MSRHSSLFLVWAALSLAGCGEGGNASARLLESLRQPGDGQDLQALIAEDAVLVQAGGMAQGGPEVARGLSELSVGGSARIEQHHDVARVTLADGSLLFARATAEGRVGTVLHFPSGAQVAASDGVTAYQEAWNTADAAQRASLLTGSWADEGLYVDPSAQAQGREALGPL